MLPVLTSKITSTPLPQRSDSSLIPQTMPLIPLFSPEELKAHAREAHESSSLKPKVKERPPHTEEEIRAYRAYQRRQEIKELARKHMAKIFASLPDIKNK